MPVAHEFEVRGQQYQAARMSLQSANIVVRRLSGVLMWMAQARAALEKVNDALRKEGMDPQTPPTSEAFAQAIVGMSSDVPEADLLRAYGLCMDVVTRKTDGGWQKISAGGQMMFADIDLMAQQQIVHSVLVANDLIDFFSAGSNPPSSSSEQASSAGSSGSASRTVRTG